jgi:hypothetical protein
MDAYLDFMTSVMRFGMNWMGSVMQFGMNAMTEPLTPSPNVVIRTSASPDRQADSPNVVIRTSASPDRQADSPNVVIRTSASPDRQADIELWDVGKAAPLLDMRGVRFWTPDIRVVLNTTFYCGDITGGATAGGPFDTERQPGSVAEHDRGRADRELTVQRTVSLTPSRTDAAPPAGSTEEGKAAPEAAASTPGTAIAPDQVH